MPGSDCHETDAGEPDGDSRLLDGYLALIGAGHDGDDPPQLLRGQFHDVVLLGDVAYRLPRDEVSRRLLPSRIELLRALSQCDLPAAIPTPLSGDAAGEPLGRCHVALQRLPGVAAGPELLATTSAEAAVATDLAALLARLQELGSDSAVGQAVPRSGRDHWSRFADDVREVLYPLMSDEGRARAEAELTGVLAVDPVGRSLVHSDLGGANLLWTTDGAGPRLTGVLDWDEAGIGNQACDLASIAATFGWPLATRVGARLGGGQASLIADAKAIAETFALQQALPAALSGDRAALDDGMTRYRPDALRGERRGRGSPTGA
jgi:aminoglycoside phosphotransferase (APT) family kinase protein